MDTVSEICTLYSYMLFGLIQFFSSLVHRDEAELIQGAAILIGTFTIYMIILDSVT